jgi:transcriptional regulator GlxA family with amidase domain
MKKIGLMIPYDFKLSSVGMILEVFETVNRIYAANKKQRPFEVLIFQAPGQVQFLEGYVLKTTASRTMVDIVCIPSVTTADLDGTLDRNKPYMNWLHRQFNHGAEVASFCTGAFIFGASGLLDGKQATTHVDSCCHFIKKFPAVFTKSGHSVTMDERCYTSGGSTSAYHLLILLIQKYCGDEIAIRMSKYFAIDLDRYKQSHFSIFRPDYSHSDELVKTIQQAIEADYQYIHNIEDVLTGIPASRRNIVRRFKLATGVPPIEYLQHIRIEKAKKQLEQTNRSIAEVVNDAGYTDPKSFRKIFYKLTGITPLKYREKFKIR